MVYINTTLTYIWCFMAQDKTGQLYPSQTGQNLPHYGPDHITWFTKVVETGSS